MHSLTRSHAVTCGVLQGSILGPVFPIMYTNGIPATIKRNSPDPEVAVYADDTQTVDQGAKSHLPSMITQAGQNTAATKQNFASIGLKMDASKTQTALCGSRQNLTHIHTESPSTLDIEGEHLPLDSVVKYLGVLLDEQMTFGPHVDNLVRQMTGTLCYLARICYFLTVDATKLLVHSLVLSRLNYCSMVWGGLNKSLVSKLQTTMNFAVRVIHGAY